MSNRTGIYYSKADGSHIAEVVCPVDSPNGIGRSPSGDRVYWAETHTGRVPGHHGAGRGQRSNGSRSGLPRRIAGDAAARLARRRRPRERGRGHDRSGRQHARPAWDTIGVMSHAGLGEEFHDVLTTRHLLRGADLRTAYITLIGTGRLVAATWPHPGLALNY